MGPEHLVSIAHKAFLELDLDQVCHTLIAALLMIHFFQDDHITFEEFVRALRDIDVCKLLSVRF
jgi:hypothetical protein